MFFRGRQAEASIWRRFRSAADAFTFSADDVHFSAHVVANAERVVDLFHSLTDGESIGTDADMSVTRANEHLRFVSSQCDAGFSAARNNDDRLSGAPSIASREDRRIAARFAKARGDVRDHW